MSEIKDVVKVSVSISNLGTSKEGFGIAAAFGPALSVPLNRVDYYDQSTEPVNNPGNVDDTIVQSYGAYFSPSPKPTLFGVGRIKLAMFFLKLVGTPILGDYSFDLHWKLEDEDEESATVSYTPGYATFEDILNGFATEINDDDDLPFTCMAIVDQELLIIIPDEDDSELPLIGIQNALAPTALAALYWDTLPYAALVSATDNIQPDHQYDMELNNETMSFTTSGAPDEDELFEGWAALINAEGYNDLFAFAISDTQSLLVIVNKVGCCRRDIDFPNEEEEITYAFNYAETISEVYDACKLASPNWYAFGVLDRSKYIQKASSDKAKVKEEETIFGYASSDSDAINEDDGGDSVAAYCSGLDRDTTWGIYNQLANGYVNSESVGEEWHDFGWFASRLTIDLDQKTATWMFAELKEFTPTPGLTPTQKLRLIGDVSNSGPVGGLRMNFLDEVDDRRFMREGCMHSGEWIDTIVGNHHTVARMESAIFNALIDADKVPYTNDGIAIIVTQITSILQLKQATGFFAFDSELNELLGFYLTYPNRNDVPEAQRDNRYLSQIKWRAALAGAIHRVYTEGVVSS